MNIGTRRGIVIIGISVAWLGIAVSARGISSSTLHSSASFNDSKEKAGLGAAFLRWGNHAFAMEGGQAGSQDKPKLSDEVFKNVQVLKGIPVDDFLQTMGMMSAAASQDCAGCHEGAGTQFVKWEVDTPRKVTARRMVSMMTAINRDNFGGRQVVTCWTCHRGRDRPVVTPSLDTVYGTPILEPDDVLSPASGQPSADQILDKYLEAIGGARRLATVTSFVAKGTSVGFGGLGGGGQVEIDAKAPDQRATQIRFADPDRGDSDRIFDGRGGWIATPLAVLREYPLSGGELDGARVDAQLSFPGQIKRVLTNLRVGEPSSIKDRDVQVVQGNGSRGLIVTLYFDKESGLLVRLVRFARGPIGRIPTQVDYSDYRDVGGIKMPFRWTFSWLDGQDAFQLREVQLNVPIDAAKFGRPSPPR
jgi:photosynthetic reaction center cytochrome c subunit